MPSLSAVTREARWRRCCVLAPHRRRQGQDRKDAAAQAALPRGTKPRHKHSIEQKDDALWVRRGGSTASSIRSIPVRSSTRTGTASATSRATVTSLTSIASSPKRTGGASSCRSLTAFWADLGDCTDFNELGTNRIAML